MTQQTNLILKHTKETLSLVRVMKDIYNSSVEDKELLTPKDINIILDLIIEKMEIIVNSFK